MNIYVGNMPYSTTEEELNTAFDAYGEISRVHIVMYRETGRAKGFDFVEMPNDEDAKKAMEALDGSSMGGRALVVKEARPREERPRRFNGPRAPRA